MLKSNYRNGIETRHGSRRRKTLSDDAPHLLVVDDDTRIRSLLSQYLTNSGFRVTMAGSAAEARRKLEGIDFDLLILDVMMPGETGVSLTRSLREQKNVPILMLTALSETDSRIDGLAAGADDYLPKPFDPRELTLRINNILRRGASGAAEDRTDSVRPLHFLHPAPRIEEGFRNDQADGSRTGYHGDLRGARR